MTEYNEQLVKEAIASGANNAIMAEQLGVSERTMRRWKAKLAVSGYSPEHDMTRQVPDGFKVRGVSSLYNKDGVLSAQWIKSGADDERRYQMMLEAVEALNEVVVRAEPIEGPTDTIEELLNCYVITDYHFGQLSWGEETRGEDYDLKIAEKQLIDWFAMAISAAPDAKIGIFAQVGDFLHYSGSGLQATTEASGHILDADGRFQKMVRVVVRTVRKVINMLLEKHDLVHVKMCEGNHDTSASCWLREMLYAMYEHEPRITVDRSADPYYAYEFGASSLFFHHGHKKKVSDISQVFVSKFRDMFGRTSKSYAHMGHLHHVDVKENNLMIVEQHRTLAAADAHSSRGGYSSGRDAKVITYHHKWGEVGRITINSDMLK